MSNRDKELKESFMSLFSAKLIETSTTFFTRKRDPLVGDMSFSDDEIKEIELEVRNVLFEGKNKDDSAET